MREEGSGLMCEMDEDVNPLEETDEDLAVELDPTGRFARYNVILGKGSSKVVYKAFDRVQGIEVAWNQIRLSDSLKHPLRSRLFSEIAVLGKLKHRNIMTFYTSWLDDQHRTVNFITEYFHSGTLRRHRLAHKCITLQVLKRWAWQILQGLVYLHGHDPPIIHRDLKCDNIFIHGVTGEVKIGDLGMAKLLTSGLSKAQSVLGTPEYMAPELYDERYNEKVDIYAYGMCLMELVCMEFPYMECDNRCQIFRKVTLGVYPAALSRIEETEVRDFIELCISHDHTRRPSARELIKHPFFDSLRNDQEFVSSPSHASRSEVVPDMSESNDACRGHSCLRTFHLRATDVQSEIVKFKLRMKSSGGSIKCLAFHFDIDFDTVDAVAQEMEEDFDLLPAEAAMFKSLLEEEMVKARSFIEIGSRSSGTSPPVPTVGTSSEITASCEGMSAELKEVTSVSQQYLSDEVTTFNAPDQLRSRVDSFGDKKNPKGPVEHNSSSLGTGDHIDVVKDHLQSPWAFQDANLKMGVPVRTCTSGSRARSIRIHALQRKRCASEPCLSLEEVCDFEPGLPSRVMPEGEPMVESLSMHHADAANSVARQPLLRQKLETHEAFDGEDVELSSVRAGGGPMLRNDTVKVVQPLLKPKMSMKNVSAEMQCISRLLCRSHGEETRPNNSQPHPVNVLKLNERSLSIWVGLNKAGSLQRCLQQEQAGLRASHDRRRSWSSTMKHEQQQGERKKTIGQWLGQEVKLIDLCNSREVAKMAGNWDAQDTAQPQLAAGCAGDPHHKFELNRQRLPQLGGCSEEYGCLKAYHGCFAAGGGDGGATGRGNGMDSHFESYASMLHGKSSSDGLKSRPSAQAERSVEEIPWYKKSTETGAMQIKERVDGSCQDDVDRIKRCASVPPESAGGPVFVGPRAQPSVSSLTDRHSSSCGSNASGWSLWRKLALKVLKLSNGEHQIYDVEPQIAASAKLFHCSSGSCVPLQHRESSPIMPGVQAM